MSTDTPNTPDESVPHEQVSLEPQVSPAQPAPEPVKPARYTEKHTPENTTMGKAQPSVAEFSRDPTEAELKNLGQVNIFLGNSKETQERAGMVISRWLAMEYVREQHQANMVTDGQLGKAESDWKEFVDEHLPGKTPQQAAEYAADLYTFINEMQNSILIRTKMMGEEGLSNVSDRGGVVGPDIFGKKPGRNIEGFSLSQIVERSSHAANQTPMQYDITCRNSFVVFTIESPSKGDMGILLNNIRRVVGGYVRQINSNNMVLASSAARKVIWSFIADKIVSCSVTDIGDYHQLSDVILGVDFDTICMGLLSAFTDKGVHHWLSCLNKDCDWGASKLTVPAHMVHIRHSVQSNADAAMIANLMNKQVKLTKAETRALSQASTYGLESNKIYNENHTLFLESAPPTLSQEFACFDYFVSEVNPTLAELRQTITNPTEYETEVSLVYANLGATEYLHWISAYGVVEQPDADQAPIYIKREGADQAEFNKGMYGLIKRDMSLNKGLVSFVLNKAPYMSRTFVGVRNYTCPKCGEHSGNHQDPGGLLERRLGYTPINAVMSFFIHTQLLWIEMSMELEGHRQQALS